MARGMIRGGRIISGRAVLCGLVVWAAAMFSVQGSAAAELPAAELGDQKAKKAEAEARLNGTEWTIELNRLNTEKKSRPLTDTLRFDGGTVTSERLTSDGYSPTNYSLTVRNEIPVWETMQTSEEDGVVFWRGDVHGEAMGGIFSHHPLKGDSKDYALRGQLVSTSPPPAPPPVDEPVPAAAEPDAPEPAAAEQGGVQREPIEQATESQAADVGETVLTKTPTDTPGKSEQPKKKRKGWFGR